MFTGITQGDFGAVENVLLESALQPRYDVGVVGQQVELAIVEQASIVQVGTAHQRLIVDDHGFRMQHSPVVFVYLDSSLQ